MDGDRLPGTELAPFPEFRMSKNVSCSVMEARLSAWQKMELAREQQDGCRWDGYLGPSNIH